MAHVPDSAHDGEGSPAATPQVAELDDRDRSLAERERQLADARAAFRRERDAARDQIVADRATAEHLLRDARHLHNEATCARSRTKRLAGRFARRVRQKWAAVRAELDARQAALDEARGQFTAELAKFNAARSDFHVAAAEEAERLREAWAALDAQRQRAAAEWAEANEYAAQCDAAHSAREADLAALEHAVAGEKARLDRQTAGLRQEAVSLEARIQHSRTAVEELERRRDQLRAELLAAHVPEAEPPAELRVALDRAADRDLTEWAADLDARDKHLTQERAALTALKAALERDADALADRQRIVAEQFVMLATARGEWQDAEQRTVAEMEELARSLRRREEDHDAREQRLMRADARRREDAHDLWRLRLRLEAWQSKLTAFERRWHAEREERAAEYDRRVKALAHRETAVEELLLRWERVRVDERDRLRTELRMWADDRTRFTEAVAAYDHRAKELLAELAAHAARALAAEEALAKAGAGGDPARAARRLAVMRKRWERAFGKKLDEIDARRSAADADFARLDERAQDVQRALADLAGREADWNTRAARADLARVLAGPHDPDGDLPLADEPAGDSAELAALRDEVERMAAVLIEAGVPEPPPDADLPWAAEEPATAADADVLPFRPHASQAA